MQDIFEKLLSYLSQTENIVQQFQNENLGSDRSFGNGC